MLWRTFLIFCCIIGSPLSANATDNHATPDDKSKVIFSGIIDPSAQHSVRLAMTAAPHNDRHSETKNSPRTRYGERIAELFPTPSPSPSPDSPATPSSHHVTNDPRIVLLEEGYAQRFPEDGTDSPALISAERRAIDTKRGLWSNPCCRIITDLEAADHTQEWRIVRGRVFAVKAYRKTTYVNFGEDWKKDFTVSIPAKMAAELHPEEWEGREIEVRGWIHWSNGPMIDLLAPAQVQDREQETPQ